MNPCPLKTIHSPISAIRVVDTRTYSEKRVALKQLMSPVGDESFENPNCYLPNGGMDPGHTRPQMSSGTGSVRGVYRRHKSITGLTNQSTTTSVQHTDWPAMPGGIGSRMALVASTVEHTLGKGGVVGASPTQGFCTCFAPMRFHVLD